MSIVSAVQSVVLCYGSLSRRRLQLSMCELKAATLESRQGTSLVTAYAVALQFYSAWLLDQVDSFRLLNPQEQKDGEAQGGDAGFTNTGGRWICDDVFTPSWKYQRLPGGDGIIKGLYCISPTF